MKVISSKSLFNLIAPVYGTFYKGQKNDYRELINRFSEELNLNNNTVLDIGCGTGAFCSALNESGFKVTGIDVAEKMIKIAKTKNNTSDINFEVADVMNGLSYKDNSFDIVIASYVLHGLKHKERMMTYKEMKRIAKEVVIIHDYSKNRKLLTTVIEYFEGGDYFNFIKVADKEMNRIFSKVEIINISDMANWYICRQ